MYGLIGYPIEHSQSPALFRAYAPQRAYADYQLFSLPELRVLPQLLSTYYPKGLNVTTPYKEEVLQLFPDIELSAEVKRIGATNVLTFDYGTWDRERSPLPPCRAYNTDVYGFCESLRPRLRTEYREVFIFGTGGAARAVALALENLGYAEHYSFVSRTPEASKEALRIFGASKPCKVISYEDLGLRLGTGQIIINATPLGLTEGQAPPIPYERLGADCLCYDLVYKGGDTPFLQQAQLYGAMCVNGAEMLRLQAEASWAIWLDAEHRVN